MTRGGRNLIIMGVVAVIIAFVTTAISVVVYHQSGDIYLDRSRPGFLPDKEEIEESEGEEAPEYDFPTDGNEVDAVLDEYLKSLDLELQAIDAYQDPFSADVLSDEHFGI